MKKENDVRIQKYEIIKCIFAVLGASFLVGASVSVPTIPFVLGMVVKGVKSMRKDNIDEKKIIRTLHKLKEREVISFEEKGSEVFVKVNEKWRTKVAQYSIASLFSFKRETIWKGEWYAVFFDVPEIQRNKRDKLRVYLKTIGFYQYQKSVYVFPYSCYDEVALIKQIVEGGSYLKYAVIKQIEGERDLKVYFGLN